MVAKMQMLIFLPIVFVSCVISPVLSEGFKCPNSNFRIFVVHANLNDLWTGSFVDANTMCRKAGHVPAKSTSCLMELYQNASNTEALFGKNIPKNVWIDQSVKQPNETNCVSWANNSTELIDCARRNAALCQGLSAEDNVLSEQFKSGKFPVTHTFSAPSSGKESLPVIDAYYVLCGALGVVLIAIIVSAAIWRSGYINNKYSFRRLPPANAPPQKSTPKSRTVTSQLDSEIPHGYVKASVTKETIA